MIKKNSSLIFSRKIEANVVEQELKIPPDYQYKAITEGNFIQANWHKNKLFVIKKLLDFDKEMTILDLGTGSGNFEIFFSQYVKEIIGVDYNDEALDFLNNYLYTHKIKNVNLVLSDIRDLKLLKKINKFDLILLIDVIEHFKFHDVQKIFKSLGSYLKNDGKVIIVTPNYKSLWPALEYAFDFLGLAPKFRKHQHLSKLYKKNLEQLINDNDFQIERVCSFNLFSYLIPFRKISEKLCFLEISLPTLFGNLIAVVFSKSAKKVD